MKLLGLGFLMGAKDKGLGDGLAGVSKSLRSIDSASSRLDRVLGASLLPRFVRNIPTMQLDALGRSVDSLSDKFSVNGGLTTSIEQFGITAAKSSRQTAFRMGGDMGAIESKMRQVSSAAYSLNASAETAQQGMMELSSKFTEAEIAALGFDKAANLVRAAEMMGDFKGYVGVLDQLSHNLGFSAKSARELADDVYRIGGAFGQGEFAVSQMSSTLGVLSEQFALLPESVRPEKIREATEQITALAGVLSRSGFSAEDAWDKSRELFKFLSMDRASLEKVLAGQDAELFTSLGKVVPVFQDIGRAQKILAESPLEFMRIMTESYKGMDKNSQEARYLRGVMNDLGMVWALDNESFDKYVNSIVDGEGKIKKSGKGILDAANSMYSAALSLDEQIDRVKDSFETRLNRIASKELGSLVGRTKKSYKMLGDILEDFASDKGPLGLIVTKMVAVRRIGMSALFPTFGALGDMALQAVVDMAPMLAALGSMGFRFEHLMVPLTKLNGLFLGLPGTLLSIAGPIALVAGGVALLGNVFGEGSVMSKAFQERLDALPESVLRLVSFFGGDKLDKKLLGGFRSLDKSAQWDYVLDYGKGVAQKFWSGFSEAFTKGLKLIGGWLRDGFGWVFNDALPWVGEQTRRLLGFVVDTVRSTDWQALGDTVSGWLMAGWKWAIDVAWPWVKDVVSRMYHSVLDVVDWREAGNSISRWFQRSWDWAVDDAWPWVKKASVRLYHAAAMQIRSVNWEGIGRAAWNWLSDSGGWMLGKIEEYGYKLLGAIESGVVWVFDNFPRLWEAVKPWATLAGRSIWGWLGKGFELATSGTEVLSKIVLGLSNMVGKALDGVAKFLVSAEAAGWLLKVADTLSSVILTVFDAAFSGLFGFEVDPGVISTPLERSFANLGKSVGVIVSHLTGFLRTVFVGLWDKVTDRISDWWNDPSKTLSDKFTDLLKTVFSATVIGAVISSSFRQGLFSALSGMANWVRQGQIVKSLGKIQESLCMGATPTAGCIEKGMGGAIGAGAAGAAGAARGPGGRYLPGFEPGGRAGPRMPVPAVEPAAPTFMQRAGAGWGKAKGLGAAAMGRVGPAVGYAVAGQLAGSLIGALGEEGGVMSSVGGVVGTAASAAAIGSILGPLGTLGGAAIGAAKGLVDVYFASKDRYKAELAEASKLRARQWAKDFVDDVHDAAKGVSEAFKIVDAVGSRVSETLKSVDAQFQQLNGIVSQTHASYQGEISALESVIGGLRGYVSGDAVLSPTQIGAVSGAISAMRDAGLITAEQFAAFNSTGSLKGMSEQMVPLNAALKMESDILTNADRIYAMNVETAMLKYQAEKYRREAGMSRGSEELTKIRSKQDVALEATSKLVSAAEAVANETTNQMAAIDAYNRSVHAQMVISQGYQQSAFADLAGLSNKQLLEIAASQDSLKAAALQGVTEIQMVAESLGVALPESVYSAFASMFGDLGGDREVDVGALSSGFTIGIESLRTEASNLALAALEVEDSINGFVAQEDAALGVLSQSLIDAGIVAEKQREMDQKKVAQAAISAAEEEKRNKQVADFNKVHARGLAEILTDQEKMKVVTKGALDDALAWGRVQEIERSMRFAVAQAEALRGTVSSDVLDAAITEIVTSAAGFRTNFEDPDKAFSDILKRRGLLLDTFAGGGITDYPSSGRLAVLHGRELVYPLDAAPSREARAGLARLAGGMEVRSAPYKDVHKTLAVTVDGGGTEELIGVLRDELGAVRGAITGTRRYVLVDGKNRTVGAIEERSKGAAVGG